MNLQEFILCQFFWEGKGEKEGEDNKDNKGKDGEEGKEEKEEPRRSYSTQAGHKTGRNPASHRGNPQGQP